MPAPTIEDIGAARMGSETYAPASISVALDQLRAFGVLIVRNAFDPNRIAGLLDRVAEHRRFVEAEARAGLSYFNFEESYLWNAGNLACEVTALDPWTAGQSTDYPGTSMHRAIMEQEITRDVLLHALGADLFWWAARVRVVLPGNDGKAHGRLRLHTELTIFPHLNGLHNIWAPLLAPGVTTNLGCPGIQFFTGRLAWFKEMSIPHRDQVEAFLATFKQTMTEETAVLDEDGSFFYRPTLRTGDLAIFSGAVPHTAYVPPTAKTSRVNFDIRLFQRSEEWRAKPLDIESDVTAARLSTSKQNAYAYADRRP